MKKISIITLGCAKNQADTENLSRSLQNRGYAVENDPAGADAIVVHTCSFIDAAKQESLQTIVDAAKLKDQGKKLFVTGCLVQQHGPELIEELPEVDAFLGTGQLGQVAELLEKPRPRFLDRKNPGGLMDAEGGRALVDAGPTATLRLSEGCSHPCSFCVIPRLRGGLKSRREETLVAEAQSLVSQGVEELVIIGQDTGDWGRDLYGELALPRLLRRLRNLPGVRWIRLLYMHPVSFTEELLDVFAESPDVFPYLDMPLQHIDHDLLMDMKRKLGEGDLRRLLDRLHARVPNLSLRTTFIVGYPGETEAQFGKLNAFVKEGHFNHLGAFTYSQEEGTPAGKRERQVPEEVRKERLAALQNTHFETAAAKARSRLGRVETVVLENSEGDEVMGRSAWEAPEIDAVIRLPRAATRGGRFVPARLTGYEAFEYTAEPVSK